LRYRHFNLAKQRHNLVPPSLFFGMVSLLTKAVSLSNRATSTRTLNSITATVPFV